MKYALLAFALFLLSIAAEANADPDATTRFLINTPATLMDVGIEGLRKDLDEALRPDWVVGYGRSVGYKWDENRIVLEVILSPRSTPRSRSATEQEATQIMKRVRQYFGVSNGGAVDGVSFAARRFMHAGYTNPGEPKEEWAKLDKLFVIKVWGNADEGLFICNAPLVGKEMLCGKTSKEELLK